MTVYDQGGATAQGSQAVTVADALVGWGQTYQIASGQSTFSGVVATFFNPGGAIDAGDFTASVNVLGENYQSLQNVPCTVATGSVTGELYVNCPLITLPDDQYDTFSVSVSEDGTPVSITVNGVPVSAVTTVASSWSSQQIFVDGGYATATAGQQFTAQLAAFSDSNPNVTARLVLSQRRLGRRNGVPRRRMG